MSISDAILIDVYRTRLYLPLVLFALCYCLFPIVRKEIAKIGVILERQNKYILMVLLFLITLITAWLVCYKDKSWGGDYSQYFAQARAIADGTLDAWYKKNIFIINTSAEGIGSDVYPWIWAILLVPIYKLFGFNITILKFYSCLFMAMAIVILFAIFIRRFGQKVSFVLAIVLLFNVDYLIAVNTIESDIPCLFFTALTVLTIDKFHEDGLKNKYVWAIITGVLLFVSEETRTMAKGLIVALAIYDFYTLISNRRWLDIIKNKKYSLAVSTILPYISYFISRNVFHLALPKSGGTYNGYFDFTVERLIHNVNGYWEVYVELFASNVRPIIMVLSSIGLAVLLIMTFIGAVFSNKNELYITSYVCVMMGMLFFYDYINTRFVYSIYPFILLLSMHGLLGVKDKLKNNYVINNIYILSLCLYLIITIAAWGTVASYIQRGKYNLDEANSDKAEEVYSYINSNLDDDCVVYFFKPRVLYLNTNVYSYTRYNEYNALQEADYALLSIYDGYDRVLEDVEKMNGDKVFDNEYFQLYKLR